MAGILAVSPSLAMSAADTEADKTVVGFTAGELIVLGTHPIGLLYSWSLRKPSASAYGASRLSDAASATPTFTPDAEGAYTVSVTADGVDYRLVLGVQSTLPADTRRSCDLISEPNAELPTPAPGGLTVFFSEELGALAVKDDAGVVTKIALES